jgi:biotin--protein ligase
LDKKESGSVSKPNSGPAQSTVTMKSDKKEAVSVSKVDSKEKPSNKSKPEPVKSSEELKPSKPGASSTNKDEMKSEAIQSEVLKKTDITGNKDSEVMKTDESTSVTLKTVESKPESSSNGVESKPETSKGIRPKRPTLKRTQKNSLMSCKPPNILVYSDSLVTRDNTLMTLRKILECNSYTVYPLSVNDVASKIWMDNTILLVVCGPVEHKTAKILLDYFLYGGKMLCLCSDLLHIVLNTYRTAEVSNKPG